MTLQSDAQSLKATLDGIAADVAPIQSGIASLQANLAAALSTTPPDPNLLQGALSEATDLKTKFDAIAAGFAAAGSPVPQTAAPSAPAAPPASGGTSAPGSDQTGTSDPNANAGGTGASS